MHSNATWIDRTLSHVPICLLAWGVKKQTLALMIQHAANETKETNWPNVRNDARQYVQSCPTYHKMDARHKTYQVNDYVLRR